MKRQLGIAILAATFSCPAVWAQSDSIASARASMDISSGSAQVVTGSFRMVDASGQFLVTAIESTARGASVVLQGASDASGASVTLVVDAATASALAVGTAVTASANAVGHLLTAGGKAIAFVPNEIGRSLLHQSRHQP